MAIRPANPAVIPETRGRKPTYKDKTELRNRIDEYFADCENKQVFADYAGLRLHLKLTKQQISDMCDPDITKDAQDYIDIFEYAKDRRESLLIRKMVTDGKAATGCKAALALPENGGYTDKPHENKDRQIKIVQSKETEELFK